MALHRNFSGPVSTTEPGKSSKEAASLVAGIRKKIFGWEVQVFCEWRHKWNTFGHLGPLHLALGPNC